MGTTQSAEQLKQKRIDKMGEDLGIMYDLINNDFVWIMYRWHEYDKLFGEKETRINIMNETAPFFFFVVQKTFWEDILLGISRLTDPPKTNNKKKNVTVRSFPNLIVDEKFKEKVTRQIDLILESSNFCRDWRNRQISHSDYLLATNNSKAKPLQEASKSKLRIVLIQFNTLLNLFEQNYFDATTYFDGAKSNSGAIALLRLLDEGLDSRKERHEKIKSGDYNNKNFRKKDI